MKCDNTYIIGKELNPNIGILSQDRLQEIKKSASKYYPHINCDIALIHPAKDDVIVVSLDDTMSVTEADRFIHLLSDTFPNNRIVGMPKNFDIDIYENKDFAKVLRRLLEELEK